MDKRTFLKVLTSAAVAPVSHAASPKLINWAGNIEFSTAAVQQPSTIGGVAEIVKANPKLRVLGTRHSFNPIADSRELLLSQASIPESIVIDRAAKTVTVNAGITYGRLAPQLDAEGFGLHNLASLPHISVAGSCSTGTHGSGETNGNLATAVSALEIVNGSGDVIHLSRAKDGDTFRGAVVGLGSLGVIVKVTLDLKPSFKLRQWVYQNLSMDEMKNNFDAIQSSGYSVSLFTDWQKHRINEVWLKSRAEDQVHAHAHGPEHFYGATRATKDLHPIAELSAENCTAQMGVAGPWYDRLPHFRMGFTPSAGKELQSEYFVPRAQAVEAILAIERLRDQITPHLLISEIRTIAADDLWMSPHYKRPSVAIHFTWKQDWPAVSKLLPIVERELGPFKPRPHWGKLFTISPAQLRASYERMPDFIALCDRMDPKKKFRNEFVGQNVFGR